MFKYYSLIYCFVFELVLIAFLWKKRSKSQAMQAGGKQVTARRTALRC